jgi:hypothetical protein
MSLALSFFVAFAKINGSIDLSMVFMKFPEQYNNQYTPNRESQCTVSLKHKSPWDATHSGSQRSQCKIMQISMGRCAPAIIYFVCLMFGVFYGSKIRNHIVDAASMQSLF